MEEESGSRRIFNRALGIYFSREIFSVCSNTQSPQNKQKHNSPWGYSTKQAYLMTQGYIKKAS